MKNVYNLKLCDKMVWYILFQILIKIYRAAENVFSSQKALLVHIKSFNISYGTLRVQVHLLFLEFTNVDWEDKPLPLRQLY